MNQLAGIITNIETSEGISLVSLDVNGIPCASLVIDTPETAPYLRTGKLVSVIFKETELAIGKNLAGGLSILNRFTVTIQALQSGKVLTKVDLDCRGAALTAIITTRSALELGLAVGDTVEGLIKTNEVSILEQPL
jgi:molybdopterin-binding protein